MKAQEAYNSLNPQAWAITPVSVRLTLIKQIQKNLKRYAQELGRTDAEMKNKLIGENITSVSEGMGSTVMPMAQTLKGIENLYKSLAKGAMPKPLGIEQLGENLYKVKVYPIYPKERLIARKQVGYLFIDSKPKQTNPMDKPAGVIAISGAGNYSSSIETLKALFLENKAAIHMPHGLNEASDAIWAQILKPLVQCKALAFCEPHQGRELSALTGLYAIYFTGSTQVAHAIQNQASAPLVSECGGNNPCIIVPGRWREEDIHRQAVGLASMAKLNGGAVCGRPQTIVTCKHWPQRNSFLKALKKAIEEETFAVSSYYPSTEKSKAAFLEHEPTAQILKPEGGRYKNSDFILIEDIGEDDFAIQHEAFCQLLDEIALDCPEDVDAFLTKATEFCNTKLLGTLGCMILVDNETWNSHEPRMHQAIEQLNYGAVTINDVPPSVWLNPYLTWGGYGETKENFVSGVGNFGNAFNYENVKKSAIVNDFNVMIYNFTNRKATENLFKNLSYFSIHHSWSAFLKMVLQMRDDKCKENNG